MTACAKCGYDPRARVAASWTLVLPLELKSANSYMTNHGASRWRYAEARDEWVSAVTVEVHRIALANGPMMAQSHPLRRRAISGLRRVTITRMFAGRKRAWDRDNLVASVKPLVDAMVRCGVLVDDNDAHLQLHVQQERGTTCETRVLVEEMEQ